MHELLWADNKNDPENADVAINDLANNDSEFLLRQYADDSSVVLNGVQKFPNQFLYLFDKLSECAELRCYVYKTEVVWIG